MRKIFYIALILLLISSIQVSAGDSALSEISALFTQNVVISDYMIQEYNSLPENGTFYDNEARLLYVDEHSFPYPREIESINSTRIADNSITIFVNEPLPDIEGATNRSPQGWVWFFNLETEDFSRFTPLCNEQDVAEFSTPWVYLTDSQTNHVYLCETATGHRSEALPDNLSWAVPSPFSDGSLPVFYSPEGHWLLLFGEQDEHTYIFSYEIEASRLINLGSIPCNYCIEPISVKWFGSIVNIWTYSDGINSIYSRNRTLNR